MLMAGKKAVIIGAGPAGLTAAYELVKKTDLEVSVYEMGAEVGGISKTITYKGNRIDIGGHRFFSKSDKVMKWWLNILPLQSAPSKDDMILGREIPLSQENHGADPEKTDRVMLFRRRLSRIFFLRKFFDYPVSLSSSTISNLGLARIVKIGASYAKIRLFPIREEKSLEDFFINRFGKELYLLFFKDYTEKVWGVGCDKIPPEWGAQRVKGMSISKAVIHSAKKLISKDPSIAQKKTETSLIEQFMYPKLGPGQVWEEVAGKIKEGGGRIYLNHRVVGVKCQGRRIAGLTIRDESSGASEHIEADYFLSTMPVRDLISSFETNEVPPEVRKVANGLIYRDFITVGLLLKKLKVMNRTNIKTVNNLIPDNWIYIQEKDVLLGRLQVFNNWSPYMVKDQNTVWLGLEYFCDEGDELWNKPDKEVAAFAVSEMVKIDMIESQDVIDNVVIRVQKTYPAYFGSYARFGEIREFTDRFENLFLIGRNGMHRYNNQDHSMLTAMAAVENIIQGVTRKGNIWDVNAEKEYHEERS